MSIQYLISKQLEHKLHRNWEKITKGDHYRIPESVDEIRNLQENQRFGPFPFFMGSGNIAFANDTVKKALGEFTYFLREELGADLFSCETIESVIHEEIKKYFYENVRKPFDWHLQRIIATIKSENHYRQHIRVVLGLKLEGIEEIKYGSWKLITFSEERVKEFTSQDSGDEEWQDHVEDFLKKHFVGKVCLLVENNGDLEQSTLKADYIARYVVNAFRYFICIHLARSSNAHEFGIFMGISDYAPKNNLSFNVDDRMSTLSRGYDSWRQEYKLSNEYLKILIKSWNAESLWSLIEKTQRTDLEDSIVTAITWIGDAQQEIDNHVAYVKYWTALEALVIGHDKVELVARLKKSLPILISNISGNAPSKTAVAKAYDFRSKILHTGSSAKLKITDLNKVCTWAYQCIAACISLLKLGYKTRAQVEKETFRIEKLKPRR